MSQVPHDASTNPESPELPGPAGRLQWLGLLLSPLAFALHFQLNYLLVLWACGNDSGMLLVHVTSVIALALCVAGGWAALETWRRGGRDTPSDGEGVLPRTRLLGVLGLGLSTILGLILLMQFISGFVPPRCQ